MAHPHSRQRTNHPLSLMGARGDKTVKIKKRKRSRPRRTLTECRNPAHAGQDCWVYRFRLRRQHEIHVRTLFLFEFNEPVYFDF